MKSHHLACLVAMASLLAACGGTDNSQPVITPIVSPSVPLILKGTAAAGLALSGDTVNAKCQGGNGNSTTAADGSYSISISANASLPCVLEVSDTVSNTKLHAIAIHDGIVNLTPLTEMLSTRLLRSDMVAVFANPNLDAISKTVTDTSIKTGQLEVGKAVSKLANTSKLDNFFSTPLKAATATNRSGGDDQDKLLDSLYNNLDDKLKPLLLKMLASAKSINDIFALENKTCLLVGSDGVPVACLTNIGDNSPYINITPAALLLPPGGTRSFAADINYPDNVTYIRQPVTWSVQEENGGSISINGDYTAPGKPGTYHVIASRDDFPAVSTTSIVLVDTPSRNFLPTLSVNTRSIKIRPGDSTSLTADINYVPGVFYIRAPVSWSVLEPDGGMITLQGTYTAPQKPGLYHVKVQRDDYPGLFVVLGVNVNFPDD